MEKTDSRQQNSEEQNSGTSPLSQEGGTSAGVKLSKDSISADGKAASAEKKNVTAEEEERRKTINSRLSIGNVTASPRSDSERLSATETFRSDAPDYVNAEDEGTDIVLGDINQTYYVSPDTVKKAVGAVIILLVAALAWNYLIPKSGTSADKTPFTCTLINGNNVKLNVSASQWASLSVPSEIKSGSMLRTDNDRFNIFELSDGCNLRADANTSFKVNYVSKNNGVKYYSITLYKGSLYACDTINDKIKIDTKYCSVTPIGTRYQVSQTEASNLTETTDVRVSEGSVQVEHAADASVKTIVSAKQEVKVREASLEKPQAAGKRSQWTAWNESFKSPSNITGNTEILQNKAAAEQRKNNFSKKNTQTPYSYTPADIPNASAPSKYDGTAVKQASAPNTSVTESYRGSSAYSGTASYAGSGSGQTVQQPEKPDIYYGDPGTKYFRTVPAPAAPPQRPEPKSRNMASSKPRSATPSIPKTSGNLTPTNRQGTDDSTVEQGRSYRRSASGNKIPQSSSPSHRNQPKQNNASAHSKQNNPNRPATPPPPSFFVDGKNLTESFGERGSVNTYGRDLPNGNKNNSIGNTQANKLSSGSGGIAGEKAREAAEAKKRSQRPQMFMNSNGEMEPVQDFSNAAKNTSGNPLDAITDTRDVLNASSRTTDNSVLNASSNR